MPGSFFDTNIIVYIASADPKKAAKAEEVIAGGGAINVQVLNELANVESPEFAPTYSHSMVNWFEFAL